MPKQPDRDYDIMRDRAWQLDLHIIVSGDMTEADVRGVGERLRTLLVNSNLVKMADGQVDFDPITDISEFGPPGERG